MLVTNSTVLSNLKTFKLSLVLGEVIVSDVEFLFHVLAFEERWGFKFTFVHEFSNSLSINAVETRYTRRE